MTHEIKIWSIDPSSNTANRLEKMATLETEESFEDLLAKNPDLLMPGLTLVGRQTPAGGGSLDLLGVNDEGRLFVFELKRGNLSRDAVAQIVDYCSYLESLSDMELADYIVKNSGKNGISKIDDFDSWYSEREGQQRSALRPIGMVLVALGADSTTHRMVEFLAQNEVDISIRAFHGYSSPDGMLLASQTKKNVDPRPNRQRRRQSPGERLRDLDERAKKLGITYLWQDAVKSLGVDFSLGPKANGVTFWLPTITLPDDINVGGTHSVTMEGEKQIRVTFFPASVDLCSSHFDSKKSEIAFSTERPPNARTTRDVKEQWYVLLDERCWNLHKEALTDLAGGVCKAWRDYKDSGLKS